jgi:uncharacterized protein YbjT (DUF2867 family)
MAKRKAMANDKIIFVTGGTGKQGGAVARTLAAAGFVVKVLTRNPGSAKAQALKAPNLQLVKGDLNNADTYREYLNDVYGVFSVQTFENGIQKEIRQGVTLASVAKDHGVEHFIYSSLVGADLDSGVPHMESKSIIENHIRQIGLPHTILRPASLYENFLIPQVRNGIEKGKLVQPTNGNTILQYVATADIGKAARKMFLERQKSLGRTIPLATEQLTTLQVADKFSAVLNKTVKYQKLPGIIARLALGKSVYKMFQWMNESNRFQNEDLDTTRQEFPDLLSLEDWIRMHFSLQ